MDFFQKAKMQRTAKQNDFGNTKPEKGLYELLQITRIKPLKSINNG
jgi:hypothetical protein